MPMDGTNCHRSGGKVSKGMGKGEVHSNKRKPVTLLEFKTGKVEVRKKTPWYKKVISKIFKKKGV